MGHVLPQPGYQMLPQFSCDVPQSVAPAKLLHLLFEFSQRHWMSSVRPLHTMTRRVWTLNILKVRNQEWHNGEAARYIWIYHAMAIGSEIRTTSHPDISRHPCMHHNHHKCKPAMRGEPKPRDPTYVAQSQTKRLQGFPKQICPNWSKNCTFQTHPTHFDPHDSKDWAIIISRWPKQHVLAQNGS